MTIWQAKAKASFIYPVVKTTIALFIQTLVFGIFLLSPATCAENWGNNVEEDIWKLEETYFTNLYRANYEEVLALVHPQFLGWPSNLPKPINKEESAEFMRKLIPQPTTCVIRIERAGLQQSGDTVLTQYTIHIDCPEASGVVRTQSSRITHTWTKHENQWKVLGGMSIAIQKK